MESRAGKGGGAGTLLESAYFNKAIRERRAVPGDGGATTGEQ